MYSIYFIYPIVFRETELGEVDSMSGPPSMGAETRTQILPSINLDDDAGFTLPNYDFAANVPRPNQIGVKRGDSFGDVLSAAKGIGYYTDLIGFGQSSSRLTSGMDFRQLGINFFTKTGMTCSNGADMWTYFEGIPKGDAVGKTMQKAMSEMGLPELKGLAPGMLEDVKAGVNPKEIGRAAFGYVYPKCVQKTLPVGDDRGQIRDPETNDVWIKGPVEYKNGIPRQTRWVQEMDGKGNPVYMSAEAWEKAPKTHNPDGSIKKQTKEGFEDSDRASVLVAVVLLSVAFALTCGRS
jgi:hypothetical protein